jgi:hypothetical protein
MKHRLTKQRDLAAEKRAMDMHKECMKDPEYAAKWNSLMSQLTGVLCDLPPEVLSNGEET